MTTCIAGRNFTPMINTCRKCHFTLLSLIQTKSYSSPHLISLADHQVTEFHGDLKCQEGPTLQNSHRGVPDFLMFSTPRPLWSPSHFGSVLCLSAHPTSPPGPYPEALQICPFWAFGKTPSVYCWFLPHPRHSLAFEFPRIIPPLTISKWAPKSLNKSLLWTSILNLFCWTVKYLQLKSPQGLFGHLNSPL